MEDPKSRNGGTTEKRNGGKSHQILKDGTIIVDSSLRRITAVKIIYYYFPLVHYKGEKNNSCYGTCQPRERIGLTPYDVNRM